MSKSVHFINYQSLNQYVLGSAWRKAILQQWMDKDCLHENHYIGYNPKHEDAAYAALFVNLNTGRWRDSLTGDAGEDIISLCAYLFNLSYHKAALRIIETMRWSHE